MGGNLLAFWGDGYGSSRGDEPPYVVYPHEGKVQFIPFFL